MFPDVKFTQVTKEDVAHMGEWLNDKDVSASWYGTNKDGEPLHIGYTPRTVLEASDKEWAEVFDSDVRKIFSVNTVDGEHIGEAQMVIEAALWEAQLFVLIGRKDLWYQGYGTSAFVQLLDMTFDTYGLHRAWVDIPEYNRPAIHVCERIGFVLEGHLRGTHPKDGKWYDSIAMGLLADEYARRRARLMEMSSQPAVQ